MFPASCWWLTPLLTSVGPLPPPRSSVLGRSSESSSPCWHHCISLTWETGDGGGGSATMTKDISDPLHMRWWCKTGLTLFLTKGVWLSNWRTDVQLWQQLTGTGEKIPSFFLTYLRTKVRVPIRPQWVAQMEPPLWCSGLWFSCLNGERPEGETTDLLFIPLENSH